jgi:hypothetical protein
MRRNLGPAGSLTVLPSATSFRPMVTNNPSGRRIRTWPPPNLPPVDHTGLPDPRVVPTITLEVARYFLGIGRTRAYVAANTGELIPGVPIIRVGSHFRVSTAVVRRAIGIDPPAAAPAPPPAPPMRRAAGDA